MSAAELSKAAATLRERAEDSHMGPWQPDANAVRSGGTAIALTYNSHDDRDQKRKDAAYIATMHPGVGLALADWLDEGANGYLIERGYMSDKALEIARLINGGAL